MKDADALCAGGICIQIGAGPTSTSSCHEGEIGLGCIFDHGAAQIDKAIVAEIKVHRMIEQVERARAENLPVGAEVELAAC